MTSQLESLRSQSLVVADTGDIEAVARWKPQDATTNPSLLLTSAEDPRFRHLVDQAINDAKGQTTAAMDNLFVQFGCEILKHVAGRVSTEVDARLSFDADATIAKAERLVGLYEDEGISRDRILIKVASTWEGIRAARELERRGIPCNLTLLFALEQAIAGAEAGVFLISPFVGRIMDWYVANTGVKQYAPDEDPGVQSVRRIYQYYKTHGYKTVVMGASFRNVGQIQALAGCDRLTISPDLLKELEGSNEDLPRRLADDGTRTERPPAMDEARFRWGMNEDAMASDKLAEGIRKFAADQRQLEKLLAERL